MLNYYEGSNKVPRKMSPGFVVCFILETELPVLQAGLKLTLQSSLDLNSSSFCLHLSNSELTGMSVPVKNRCCLNL